MTAPEPELAAATDEQLMRRFATTGDTRAFEILIERTTPAITQFLRVRGGNATDVDDLAQATFETVISKANEFDTERSFRAWVLGIAKRHAWEHHRRIASIQPAVPPGNQTTPDQASPSAAHTAQYEELAAAVRKGIDSLPLLYRNVVRRYVEDGQRPLEISDALERDPSTVRSQLERGLAMLRKAIPRGLAPALLAGLSLPAMASAHTGTPDVEARTPPRALRGTPWLHRAGIALIAATLIVTTWLLGDSLRGSPPTIESSGSASVTSQANDAPEEPEQRNVAAAANVDEAPHRPTRLTRIRLVDARSGAPITGVSLGLAREAAASTAIARALEARTDANGVATFSTSSPRLPAVIVFDDGPSRSEPIETTQTQSVHEVLASSLLRIHGVVTDHQDAPVASAEIWLSSSRQGPGFIAGTSDTDGTYSIVAPNFREGVRVWFTARGFAPSELRSVFDSDGDIELDARLPGPSSTLRVRLPKNRGPSPVDVSVCSLEVEPRYFPVLKRRSGDDDWIEFSSLPQTGLAIVACTASACTPVIRLPSPGENATIELPPFGTDTVSGHARDSAGFPVNGIVRIAPSLHQGDRQLLWHAARSAPIHADGQFKLGGLPRGASIAWIEQEGQRAYVDRLAINGATTWNPIVDVDSAIAGRIEDTTGEPVQGARVRLCRPPSHRNRGVETRTNAEGQFRFPCQRDAEFVLTVDTGLRTDEQLPSIVRNCSTGECDLVLTIPRRRSTLRLRAVNPSCNPARDARMLIGRKGVNAHVEATANPTGAIEVRVPPGTYEAWLFDNHHGTWLPEIKVLEQTVDIGDVKLAQHGSARVRIRGNDAAAPLRCFVLPTNALMRSLRNRDPQREDDGDFVLDHLTPGPWRVMIRSPNHVSVDLDFVVCAHTESLIEVDLVRGAPCTIQFHIDHTHNHRLQSGGVLRVFDSEQKLAWETHRPLHANPQLLQVCLAPGTYRAEMTTSFGAHGASEFIVPAGGERPVIDVYVR